MIWDFFGGKCGLAGGGCRGTRSHQDPTVNQLRRFGWGIWETIAQHPSGLEKNVCNVQNKLVLRKGSVLDMLAIGLCISRHRGQIFSIGNPLFHLLKMQIVHMVLLLSLRDFVVHAYISQDPHRRCLKFIFFTSTSWEFQPHKEKKKVASSALRNLYNSQENDWYQPIPLLFLEKPLSAASCSRFTNKPHCEILL